MLDVMIVSSPEGSAALVNPLRSLLLKELRQPSSGSSIARKLNLKRQVVNYHVRELEKLGLIEFVEARRAGGMQERIFAAKARSYVIGLEALGELAPKATESESSSSKLTFVANECLSEVAKRPEGTPVFIQDLTIAFRDRDDRIACMQELTNFFVNLQKRYDQSGIGGEWRVIGAAYQKPVKTPKEI